MTEQNVKDLMVPLQYERLSTLQPHIDSAETLVDEVLGGTPVSSGLKDKIKLWMAAHFVAVANQQLANDSIDGISHTYQYVIQHGLGSTMYGQQAISLDPTGKLSMLGKGRSPGGIRNFGGSPR